MTFSIRRRKAAFASIATGLLAFAGAGAAAGRPPLRELLPVSAGPGVDSIAFISNNHALNPSVYKKMPYDSLADITLD